MCEDIRRGVRGVGFFWEELGKVGGDEGNVEELVVGGVLVFG